MLCILCTLSNFINILTSSLQITGLDSGLSSPQQQIRITNHVKIQRIHIWPYRRVMGRVQRYQTFLRAIRAIYASLSWSPIIHLYIHKRNIWPSQGMIQTNIHIVAFRHILTIIIRQAVFIRLISIYQILGRPQESISWIRTSRR